MGQANSQEAIQPLASTLEQAGLDLEIIEWEKVKPEWQAKIRGAIASFSPHCLLYPPTPEVLAKIIKIAHEHRWRVLPCGSGSKLNWGGLVKDADLVVSSDRLNRIIEHAVGDLTVTVEAGVKLSDLQQTLQQADQFLPLDPAYPDSATVGGIIATADAGSWRQRYGGVRDLVLGLTFVGADGQLAKAGGRVVKNVAGYDLMKLFTGSYGTLGIITQATLRVYPLPPASATVLLVGENSAIATAAQTLRNSGLTPTAADLLSASVVQQLELGQGMGLLVRFQSISESVNQQTAQLETVAQQLGLQIEIAADEIQLWEQLKQMGQSPTSTSAITCKIGVVPTAAVPILTQFAELTSNRGLGIVHANSGLGNLYWDTQEATEVIKMRSLCQEQRGFLTVLESPPSLKQQLDTWGYTGNALEIMRKLKQQFDPEQILSPGRFVGGI